MLPEVEARDLQAAFSYDPDTGVFRWRISPNRRIPAGSVAGGRALNGYKYLALNGRKYLAARVAWLFVHGYWPAENIDHVSRDKTDNRLSNLRLASVAQNNANSRTRRHNRSGLKGVSARGNKFAAFVTIGRKQHYLGTFLDARQAHAAYIYAARRLHGEFAHGGEP